MDRPHQRRHSGLSGQVRTGADPTGHDLLGHDSTSGDLLGHDPTDDDPTSGDPTSGDWTDDSRTVVLKSVGPDIFEPFLARCDFPPPATRVDCAVSGGADSLALLVLATAAGLNVTAVHVDHGLRPESTDEAAIVAAAAAQLGAGFRGETAQVAPGPNLEARARAARYGVLGPEALLGHTADDQAETVLLNLLRGAGLRGVAAMRSERRRPLLGLRRSDTAEVCRLAGLTPVVDASNFDPAFRRNRVRHDVLPLLNEIFERDVSTLLCRHAELAAEAVEALDGAVADVDPTDCAAVAALPRATARWALHRWITGGRRAAAAGAAAAGTAAAGTAAAEPTAAEQHPPDLAAVDRVLAVARGEARATDVGGGWRVARTAGRLRLEAPPGPPAVGEIDPPTPIRPVTRLPRATAPDGLAD